MIWCQINIAQAMNLGLLFVTSAMLAMSRAPREFFFRRSGSSSCSGPLLPATNPLTSRTPGSSEC